MVSGGLLVTDKRGKPLEFRCTSPIRPNQVQRILPFPGEGPVFRAPWEAQAFGMAVKLHEAGYFSWREWAERLAAEIKRAQDRGDPDLGTTYYEHWLAALEPIVTENRRGTRGSFDSGYDLAIPHIRIFEAIERRDPETAALVMRQHLQDLMRYLPSSYRR